MAPHRQGEWLATRLRLAQRCVHPLRGARRWWQRRRHVLPHWLPLLRPHIVERLLARELDLPLSATHASNVENAGAGARAGAVERAAAAGALALEVKLYARVREDAVRRASAQGL